jgi:hypothetical protein
MQMLGSPNQSSGVLQLSRTTHTNVQRLQLVRLLMQAMVMPNSRNLRLVPQLVLRHQLKAVDRDRKLVGPPELPPNPFADKAVGEEELTTTFRSLVFTTWPVVKH